MGLDTYAVIPTMETVETGFGPSEERRLTHAPDEPFEGINLCGGMMSGGAGSSSFRGKVYAAEIEEATGVGLYSEFIDPETVAAMADKLAANPPTTRFEDGDQLVKFFAVCKANGYGLSGWW